MPAVFAEVVEAAVLATEVGPRVGLAATTRRVLQIWVHLHLKRKRKKEGNFMDTFRAGQGNWDFLAWANAK